MSKLNPDDYPPRYRNDGGWDHLITDEPEWLARPAPWGLDVLPEATRWYKQELYNGYWYPRILSQLAEPLNCPRCRGYLPQLYHDSVLDGLHQAGSQSPLEWYANLHPDLAAGERCDGWQTLRPVMHYIRGLVCRQEVLNVLLSGLMDFNRQLRRDDVEKSLVRDRENTDWSRWISLELIGPNPFRPVAFDPAWRTSDVVGLAGRMYDARDFSPMPILADALQEAGCDADDVLNHCRGAGPHVRGCWVVDAVLGKA